MRDSILSAQTIRTLTGLERLCAQRPIQNDRYISCGVTQGRSYLALSFRNVLLGSLLVLGCCGEGYGSPRRTTLLEGDAANSGRISMPSLVESIQKHSLSRKPSCPFCSSLNCRRSVRRGERDFFMRLVGKFPWHCHGCAARFYLRKRSLRERPLGGY